MSFFGKKSDMKNLQESMENEKHPEVLELDKEGQSQEQQKIAKFVNWFAGLGRTQKRRMFPELKRKRVAQCERCKTPYNNVSFTPGIELCNPCNKLNTDERKKRKKKSKHERYKQRK